MASSAIAERNNGTTLASYFQEVNETPLLDAEEEHELALRVQEGDIEARDHLVRANLRLVVAIARRYASRGMCLQDLIQEGNLGLVHAVEMFDPEQYTRFSTYAKYWIQQSIQRALETLTTPVRVPCYANHLLLKWRRATSKLQEELGRIPTEEEVGQHLKLSKRQLQIVRKALKVYNGLPRPESQENGGKTTSELEDLNSPEPENHLEATEEMQHVLKLVDRLEERQANILRLRFGLTGKAPMALHEIGEQLNLTRERVRQIERDALATLRSLLVEE